jgi:hypothetical protein
MGVPVVSIAGNRLSRDKLPGVIEDYVDLDNASMDDWQIVPGIFPATIAVGAVEDGLSNRHFFGDAVDVWAPIRTAYVAPENVENISSPLVDDTIGGTSAAAPFIAGLIATMQAINPRLDPHGPGTNEAERRTIVDDIRSILTDEANTFSNAELVALGFANEPVERRLLVNPLAALQDAASRRENVPYVDFASLGYDDTLNFSELIAPNEGSENAVELAYGVAETGTIATIPGDIPYTPPPDVDWYRFTMPPHANTSRAYTADIIIEFPADPAGDEIIIPAGSSSVRLVESGTRNVYQSIRPQSASLSFRLTSNGDNVYRVTIDDPELAVPNVEITAPPPEQTLCAGIFNLFRANVGYPGFPGAAIPEGQIVWRDGTTVIGSGKSMTSTLTAGTHMVSVRVFDDPTLSDTITRTVQSCEGSPPSVNIDFPVFTNDPPALIVDADGFDANGAYHELTLQATVSDPDVGDTLTLTWTTDQAEVQPGGPSSGDQILGNTEDLTVRLYSSCAVEGFGTVDHKVTLLVVDSAGNATPDSRVIRVLLLC